jgi:hypothetical protein
MGRSFKTGFIPAREPLGRRRDHLVKIVRKRADDCRFAVYAFSYPPVVGRRTDSSCQLEAARGSQLKTPAGVLDMWEGGFSRILHDRRTRTGRPRGVFGGKDRIEKAIGPAEQITPKACAVVWFGSPLNAGFRLRPRVLVGISLRGSGCSKDGLKGPPLHLQISAAKAIHFRAGGCSVPVVRQIRLFPRVCLRQQFADVQRAA